jgi:hypothetical protein
MTIREPSDGGEAQKQERSWSSLLASPIFVGSIVVLVANDHVLKQAWPGHVTGKLSDIAGVVMMAILASALVRRPGAACVSVAFAFALLKTVPAVANFSIPILGGRTLTDPTDLVAVLALVPLSRWLRRPDTVRQTGSVVVKSIAVGAAVFATSATSCVDDGVWVIAVVDDVVYVEGDLDNFESDDGGKTWRPAVLDRQDVPYGAPDSACTDADVCFELVDRRIDRIDPNGTRSTDFEVTEDEFSNLVGNVGDSCSLDASLFSSIAAIEGPDGSSVVVTMGEYGVLRRSPDGVWSWVDVGNLAVGDALTRDPLDGRVPESTHLAVSAVVAAGVLIAGSVLAVVASRRRLGGWWIAVNALIGVVGGVGLGVAALGISAFAVDGARGLPYGATLAVLVGGLVLGVPLALIYRFATPRSRVPLDREGI